MALIRCPYCGRTALVTRTGAYRCTAVPSTCGWVGEPITQATEFKGGAL